MPYQIYLTRLESAQGYAVKSNTAVYTANKQKEIHDTINIKLWNKQYVSAELFSSTYVPKPKYAMQEQDRIRERVKNKLDKNHLAGVPKKTERDQSEGKARRMPGKSNEPHQIAISSECRM